MENFFTSKRGIQLTSLVGIMLALFLLGKTVYEFKASSLLGNDTPAVNTITISGKGEIVAVPDIATFSFSVIESGKTVPEAQKLATDKANKAVDAVKAKGVAEKDIKTTGFIISPKYEYQTRACANGYCPDSRQVLIGYEVSISYEVKVRDISKAGEVLASIGALSVTNVSGLTFKLDKEEVAIAKARDMAIADAKSKADSLAESLGVRIVRVTNFSEIGNYPMYYAQSAKAVGMGADMISPPSLPAGENTITSNVSVTYEIR